MTAHIFRISLVACLGLLLAGCNEATSSPPDRAFTDAQRASCPESPFKPEFPIAPKRSAEAQAISYTMEIYASRGKFINAFSGSFDPLSQNTSTPRTMIVWDGRDAAGKKVPSGYYFIAVVFTDPASGAKESRTSCVFYINDADQDKVM
jgi:hypothetical protein